MVLDGIGWYWMVFDGPGQSLSFLVSISQYQSVPVSQKFEYFIDDNVYKHISHNI